MTADELTDGGQSPYPGPRPYRIDESGSFFGRDDEARSVSGLWLGNRLTVLHGAPGVGKTSLVQAAVLRFVRRPETDILPVGSLTFRSPFSAAPLFEHNPFALSLLSSWAPLEDPATLSTMTVSGFIRRRMRRSSVTAVLAVIDQAEVLFRRAAGQERIRDDFINELAGALRDHPGLHVLLVIRDSRLVELSSDERLSADAQVMLRYLDRETAASAVLRSMAVAGRSLMPEAAEEFVSRLLGAPPDGAAGVPTTLDSEGVHPAILQIAAARLWNSLPAGTLTITKADLWQLADVDRWLAEYICHAASAVSRYRELDSRQFLTWLARTFGTAGTRVTLAEGIDVGGMPDTALFAAEDYHLLRAVLRSGSLCWELDSNRLIEPLLLAERMIINFFPWKAARPGLTVWLAAAEAAFASGELGLAHRHAQHALSISPQGDMRGLGRVETLLGNIAYQQHDNKQARIHYLNASKFFGAVENRTAVGRLLAAIGRLHLMDQDVTAALVTLQSAMGRLPGDPAIRTELARAFAAAGAGHAADAVAPSLPEAGQGG